MRRVAASAEELRQQFAKEGFNILLVSRSLDKLKTTQQELQNTYKNIDVHYIQFDFNEKTALEDYQNAFGKLTETFDISIVVNNVGTYEEGYFARVKLEDHMKLINVNVVPQTILTKLFSVYLSGRKKRSAVIDISSFTSIMPLPIFSIYAATKSFSYYLSRALAEEYKNYNIDFLAVRLLFAATKLSKKKANGWAVITADQSVEGVLNDFGYENETFGHWVHKVQAFLFSLVPKCLIYPAMRIVFRMNRKPKIKDQ